MKTFTLCKKHEIQCNKQYESKAMKLIHLLSAFTSHRIVLSLVKYFFISNNLDWLYLFM